MVTRTHGDAKRQAKHSSALTPSHTRGCSSHALQLLPCAVQEHFGCVVGGGAREARVEVVWDGREIPEVACGVRVGGGGPDLSARTVAGGRTEGNDGAVMAAGLMAPVMVGGQASPHIRPPLRVFFEHVVAAESLGNLERWSSWGEECPGTGGAERACRRSGCDGRGRAKAHRRCPAQALVR